VYIAVSCDIVKEDADVLAKPALDRDCAMVWGRGMDFLLWKSGGGQRGSKENWCNSQIAIGYSEVL
jgi:hypothetical protein